MPDFRALEGFHNPSYAGFLNYFERLTKRETKNVSHQSCVTASSGQAWRLVTDREQVGVQVMLDEDEILYRICLDSCLSF